MKYPIKAGLSPTHIQAFHTCPYKYYATYITKEVPYTENVHTNFGNAVHKNIEEYLKGTAPLSPFLEKIRPVLDIIKPVMAGAETKIGITKWNTSAKNFFDPDTYIKCIIDCVVVSPDGKKVIAFDWKTGKKSDAQVQHDVIKRCLRVAYPDADEIITCFWYFIKGGVDIQHFKPSKPLTTLDDKVAKVEQAHKTGEFPYSPNGLCKQWCDVLSCPHNGKR